MNISLHGQLDRQPSATAIQELRGHLAAFKVAHSRIAEESEFTVFLRDEYDSI